MRRDSTPEPAPGRLAADPAWQAGAVANAAIGRQTPTVPPGWITGLTPATSLGSNDLNL